MDKLLGVSDVDGVGVHADSTEEGMAGDDDRCQWIELHNVLHPRHDVADEVAVDKVRRCPAVRSRGERPAGLGY